MMMSEAITPELGEQLDELIDAMEDAMTAIREIEEGTAHVERAAGSLIKAHLGLDRAAKAMREALRRQLEEIVMEQPNDRIETPTGQAYFSSPSKSVRYDAKALDREAAGDPDLAARLGPYRKLTHRAGGLRVEGVRR